MSRIDLRRLAPTRAELIDALVHLGLAGIALATLRSSYGGIEYLVLGGVAALVGVLTAHLCDRSARRWLLTPVVGLAAYTVLASVLALRQYAFAGAIPSPNSIIESVTSAVGGWKELVTTAPPVGATGDLLVLPVVSGYLAGLLATVLARHVKFPVAALLPSMVVLGLGIAVGTNEPVSFVLHGAVFGAVAVGWLAWREHRRRPLLEGVGMRARQLLSAGLVLAVAAITGLALAPRLPGAEASNRDIWRQTVTPPFDPRQYPSPLSAYRDYVKPGYEEDGVTPKQPDVVFTIDGLPEGVPVRLATMDAYDGLVWRVSPGEPGNPSLDDSGSFERVGAKLTPEFDGDTAEVTVTIGKYHDVWVPDVGEVVSIRFSGSAGGLSRDRELANSFRYNRATDTGATVLRLQEGDRYVMTVRLPVSREKLAGAEIDPDVPRIGQTRSVGEIAQKLATPDLLGVNDTGERLDQVRDLMVEDGAYSDGDERANQIRAKAGHSAVRLTEFVQDFPRTPFIGNAEQYASTYALLFRDLDDLPTRVVMGFKRSEENTGARWNVLATEAEAWVEVPVAEVGWVGIFPTPPRDQLSRKSSTPQQPEPDYRTQNPPPPPLVDPEFDQPAKASGDAKAPDDDAKDDIANDDPSSPVESIRSFLSRPAVVGTGLAISPLVLFALFALMVVLIKRRRRSTRRRRGAAHQRIANGWLEVTDFAVDIGRPVPTATTRREAAAFVGAASVDLAHRTDAAVWGGVELTDAEVDAYWDELTTTLAAMRSELGMRDRVRAAISLHSLRRRTRGRDE